MIEIESFPEVSISNNTLSKKYGDQFYWKDSITDTGKNILKSIDKEMETHESLFIACHDGYSITSQIYYPNDIEFVKRIITKKLDKIFTIAPSQTVYLSYKLVMYNNRVIDGCLFNRAGKQEISRLLSEDLSYLETIIKEKFFSKWKPDFPLYCMTLFYLDGMKGYKIGAIEDIKEAELYKINLQFIKDKLNGKFPEQKGKKKNV